MAASDTSANPRQAGLLQALPSVTPVTCLLPNKGTCAQVLGITVDIMGEGGIPKPNAGTKPNQTLQELTRKQRIL